MHLILALINYNVWRRKHVPCIVYPYVLKCCATVEIFLLFRISTEHAVRIAAKRLRSFTPAERQTLHDFWRQWLFCVCVCAREEQNINNVLKPRKKATQIAGKRSQVVIPRGLHFCSSFFDVRFMLQDQADWVPKTLSWKAADYTTTALSSASLQQATTWQDLASHQTDERKKFKIQDRIKMHFGVPSWKADKRIQSHGMIITSPEQMCMFKNIWSSTTLTSY